jgi:hypothetical protein
MEGRRRKVGTDRRCRADLNISIYAPFFISPSATLLYCSDRLVVIVDGEPLTRFCLKW